MRNRRFLVVLATAVIACSKHAPSESGETTSVPPAGSAVSAPPADKLDAQRAAGAGDATAADRKVIRTGRVELVVGSYDDARVKLDALLASIGGYVDSTQVHHHAGSVSSATLVLRIPQNHIGAIVPKLKDLGEVRSESTTAADVTDQYIDITARLTTAQTLEKRLLEIAADRTAGVEALLAVERELARVRGEIESYQGHLRQWNDQIAMSTLTLTLTTNAPAIAATEPALGDRIQSGFSSSIAALEAFGAWLLVTGTALFPWLIVGIPALVVGRRVYHRLYRRHAKKPATPMPNAA